MFFKLADKESKLVKEKNTENYDCLEETAMAGVSCISAIQEILIANLPQDVLLSCFEQIQNLLVYSLSKQGNNYTDTALELLNRVIYNAKPLTEKMWVWFPVICYYTCGLKSFNTQTQVQDVSQEISDYYKKIMVPLKEWPSGIDGENMMRVSVILKNFMSNGNEQFLQRKDIFGTPFIQLLSNTVSVFIDRCNNDDIELEDGSICFTLIGSVFCSFTSPKLDQYLSELITYSVTTMKKFQDSVTMKHVFFHNIALAIDYDTIKTLEILKNLGILNLFLGDLMNTFKRSVIYRTRKAIMLGILSFYSLTTPQLESVG